jgi:hypothetical protein
MMTAALQQDGRILVARTYNSTVDGSVPALVRLLPNGSLDSTFNSEVPYTRIEDILVEPDQRLLVVGQLIPELLSITRLETSGRIDLTFKPIFYRALTTSTSRLDPTGKVSSGVPIMVFPR